MKLKRWAAALAVLVLLWTNTAWGETKKTMFEKEWYLQALKDSVMSTGNNARLKNVIARAQRGATVTLAAIGGSVTEGAGASTYQDCWAARFHTRFQKAYGAEAETDEAPDLDVKPVYGTDFTGLKTIFGETETDEFIVERSGFPGSDSSSYRNQPIGQVCGKNFYHDVKDPMDPLTVKGVFRKCLVAWKATNSDLFGAADILIDGKKIMTVRGGEGKWGQSEVVLVLDAREAAEHTLEIRVTEEGKRFTVTAIGLQ